MHELYILVRKEFLQIVRNKFLFRVVLIMPVIQLLILPFAGNYEIKNFRMAVVDRDHSTISRGLIDKLQAGGYFTAVAFTVSWDEAEQLLARGTVDLIVDIPQYLERGVMTGRSPRIPVHVSAINGLSAGVAGGYVASIAADYVRQLADEGKLAAPAAVKAATVLAVPTVHPAVVQVEPQQWFNPHFDTKITIVPGILALLMTIIGVAMTALNAVVEKERGTIEQLNVTPLTRRMFMLSKMVPFFVFGLFQFTVGLLITRYFYGVPFEGSIVVLYLMASLYLVGMLAFGFTLANLAQTQLQSIFLVFFFLIIMILMSGLLTPVESMPQWAQRLNLINPVAHMISTVKMVLIKGSSWADLWLQWIALGIFAVLTSVLSVATFRKQHA